eukprot:CAMPEP_0197639600 /NCGR_PEP_ID=MMETSP1338-20131121/14174_1 /TAXON_ID=43686 ORGANISM="Pelagodinium beii, Strain RCC1491" /NCGR_SAMPLE_ID=MMETSP1338 /ASSEMBLY_ACC=CAM_ASM_000754 /LENGTH=302 /DNA_ID=CAMNT_0043212347 /DNA_START=33 /DNA_END=941 /DNA_ORIENTATION=-
MVIHHRAEWVDTELKSLKIERKEDGQILVLLFSRPQEGNSWTEHMRNELCYMLDEASKDPKVRVVVVTGDPAGKAFCVGMALKDNPGDPPGDAPEGRPVNNSYARDGGGTAGLAVCRCTKPVIAAVNGNAVGVGMTFPLCCDMTVCAEDAKIGFVFGKRGISLEALSSFFLVRAVGWKKAMELVLTGRVLRASDAPAGLFNYVVPQAEVMPKALELAKEILATAPMSAMMNRQMLLRNATMSPEEAHLVESRSINALIRMPDAREGIVSFLEKRPPKFTADTIKDVPEFYPWWREIVTKSKL